MNKQAPASGQQPTPGFWLWFWATPATCAAPTARWRNRPPPCPPRSCAKPWPSWREARKRRSVFRAASRFCTPPCLRSSSPMPPATKRPCASPPTACCSHPTGWPPWPRSPRSTSFCPWTAAPKAIAPSALEPPRATTATPGLRPWPRLLRRFPRPLTINVVVGPQQAARLPQNLAALFARGFFRINLLPAYYVPWGESELVALRQGLARAAELLQGGLARGWPLKLVNIERFSSHPLFLDGLVLDTDGALYDNELFLQQRLVSAARRLRPRHLARLARGHASGRTRLAGRAGGPPSRRTARRQRAGRCRAFRVRRGPGRAARSPAPIKIAKPAALRYNRAPSGGLGSRAQGWSHVSLRVSQERPG